MPNWCYNEITLTGDLKEVSRKFQDLKQNNELQLMETLIGVPEKVEEEWEDYNRERFGSKWDIPFSEVEIQELSDNQIQFICYSAFTPIIPFLVTLSAIYKINANIFYYEVGSDYSGFCVTSLGIYADHEYDNVLEGYYLHKPDEFWDYIKSEIEIDCQNDEEDLESIYYYLTDKDLEKLKLMIATKKYNL